MAMPMAMGGEGGPPGTEMTGISFRDQLWLNSFPLERNLVFDYFALSPFYDRNCNNEQLRMKSIHPLDTSHLTKMTGIEYALHEVQEPNLFVIRKQKRESTEKVTPTAAYYILDGSIYQAPNLHNVIGSRVVRALYHITKSFKEVVNKLEKIGYDKDNETEGQKTENKGSDETKKGGEVINLKEAMRVDQILGTIHRRLPPAPPPPPIMPLVTIENPGTGVPAQTEATPTPALAPTPAQAPAPPQIAPADASVLGKQAQKSQPAEQPVAKRMKVERM